MGLVEDRPEMRLVGWVDAVDDRLDVPLDDGERRTQLVRHIGEKAAWLGLAPLEPRAHRVKGVRQPTDLARPARAQSRRIVAPLDPLGRLDEVADRPGDTPRAARPEEQEDEQDDDARDHETVRR